MHTLIVFDSQYGNTQKVAEAIAAELESAGPVDLLNVRSEGTVVVFPQDVDLLHLGGPTQMHGVTATLSSYIQALPCPGSPVSLPPRSTPRAPLAAAGRLAGIAGKLQKHGARIVLPTDGFV